MKKFDLKKTLLIVVALCVPILLMAQKANWEVTDKVYIKTTQEIDFSKSQNVAKINKTTYVLSSEDLSKAPSNVIFYTSPMWKIDQGKEQYAIDNSILLYGVVDLGQLFEYYHLNSDVISIDTIAREPLIYAVYLRNRTWEQIEELCKSMTNSFYCKTAEPNYLIYNFQRCSLTPDPSNNTFFFEQTALNGDMPLYDIHAREAWNISTGSNIKVAVIDWGFELQHPDLVNNIYSSFDCTDGADGAHNGAYGHKDAHGTKCAGIIGATNNNIGIVGVAPHCDLILIRHAYEVEEGDSIVSIGYYSWSIGALNKALEEHADVISNSWVNANGASINAFDWTLMDVCLTGRYGRGSVIVFGTGNDNSSSITYPSNNQYVIGVGASNNIGHRWNQSNYGQNLDVVAPGVTIKTTDTIKPNGSYSNAYGSITGTSAAAPMVAGVAALILSANPFLTHTQVRNIIRSTARKLPTYSFDSIAPCGTWNEEVGYGLVDAYEAVLAAVGGNEIQGPTPTCDTTKYYLRYPSASGSTINWSISNNSSVWKYSIVGPANQDTVMVKCVYTGIPSVPMMESSLPRLSTPTLSVSVTNGVYTHSYDWQLELPSWQNYPQCSIDSIGTWYVGHSRTFTVTNCLDEPDSAFLWVAKRRLGIITTHRGRTFTFTPTSFGTYIISVTNTNSECGYATVNYKFDVDYNLSMNAAWNNDQLNIEIVTDGDDIQNRDASNSYTLELWHVIYGRMYTGTMNSYSAQISAQDLPQGTYVVVLKDNGKVVAQTKVQI